ncbi:homoserine O-succinyltransferase [Clostridia bacterium]|nr:homoserine O-succinyltransferase [Clostridia bacterium]
MPIKIPDGLPAAEILSRENIFVMNSARADKQDIRPLKIALLNLMPTKVITETQLIRLLSNSALQIELTLLYTSTYTSKNTPQGHLSAFYKPFPHVKDERYDGLIITGAPVETMSFEEVSYWSELCEILEWAKTNVYSSLHICWGAQAALYYYHGVNKYPLEKKMFGVFRHDVLNPAHELLRGFDEIFFAPHSRHTEVRREDIAGVPELELLTYSDEAGVHIVSDRKNRVFFVTGHSEYDRETLAGEYFRDVDKNLPIEIPKHYFPGDDPTMSPRHIWRSHAHLLFSNWLNYFVYQASPYDFTAPHRTTLTNMETSEADPSLPLKRPSK